MRGVYINAMWTGEKVDENFVKKIRISYKHSKCRIKSKMFEIKIFFPNEKRGRNPKILTLLSPKYDIAKEDKL